MPNTTELRARAERAYELGRLWFGFRAAAIIVPLALIGMAETRAIAHVAVAGGALLTLAVFLRWSGRPGVVAANVGLQVGMVPMLAALVLCRVMPACSPLTAFAICGTGGLLAAFILARTTMANEQRAGWFGAAIVAALTASLGCIAFGLGAALGTAAATAAGMAITATTAGRATS